MITAICPGAYDPVTLGHVDVITRAAAIFDRIVVGVVGNPHHKQPMFPVEERVDFPRLRTYRLARARAAHPCADARIVLHRGLPGSAARARRRLPPADHCSRLIRTIARLEEIKMPTVTQPRLHHLALTVTDRDASVRWYGAQPGSSTSRPTASCVPTRPTSR